MLTQDQTKSAIIILLGLSAVLLLLHIRQMSQKKEKYGLTGGSMSARLATGGLTSQAARLSTGLGVVGNTQSARLTTGLGVVGGTQSAYLRNMNRATKAVAAHLHATHNIVPNGLAEQAQTISVERFAQQPTIKSAVNPNTGRVQSGQIFGMKTK